MGVPLVLHQGRTEDFLTSPARATASQLTGRTLENGILLPPSDRLVRPVGGKREQEDAAIVISRLPNGALEGRGGLQRHETDKS